jgi:Mg2+ and Co2+ transporter CorA
MTRQMLDLNNRMVDLNNRMLSANEQLLQLGNKNFDENATVKVVTILTLIYLPINLVSVRSDLKPPKSHPEA